MKVFLSSMLLFDYFVSGRPSIEKYLCQASSFFLFFLSTVELPFILLLHQYKELLTLTCQVCKVIEVARD